MMKIACHIRNDLLLARIRDGLAGCEVVRLAGGAKLESDHFAMLIVDQHGDGEVDDNILSWLRSGIGDHTPVLALLPDESAGLGPLVLDGGASDWMRQNFDPLELAARVEAIARRQNREIARRVIELRGFTLDRDTFGFSFEGKEITLTRREFSIIWMLFSSPGTYISRKSLSTLIPGTDGQKAVRSIELHMDKLQKKMRSVPGRIKAAVTAHGQGYRLEINRKDAIRGGQNNV